MYNYAHYQAIFVTIWVQLACFRVLHFTGIHRSSARQKTKTRLYFSTIEPLFSS